MWRSVRPVLLCAMLACAGSAAAAAERKAMPIGGEWNLSGRMLEKTQMDGKRVVQLTAKGDAKLKQGRNPLLGPWTLEASAEIIECDFPGKRFIVYGPYVIEKREADGTVMEISGPAPDSKVEVSFRGGAMQATGPNKTRLGEPPAAVPKARKVANPVTVEK